MGAGYSYLTNKDEAGAICLLTTAGGYLFKSKSVRLAFNLAQFVYDTIDEEFGLFNNNDNSSKIKYPQINSTYPNFYPSVSDNTRTKR
jgi:hypothetical protein